MREVSINIRSAKNVEGGQGHRFTSTRVNPGTVPDRPFDIAEQLWDFACVARPVKGMAILTWQGKWRLTYGKLNAKIKQVARGEYGDDDGFSTHSIRIAEYRTTSSSAWDGGNRWPSWHISDCQRELIMQQWACCATSSH